MTDNYRPQKWQISGSMFHHHTLTWTWSSYQHVVVSVPLVQYRGLNLHGCVDLPKAVPLISRGKQSSHSHVALPKAVPLAHNVFVVQTFTPREQIIGKLGLSPSPSQSCLLILGWTDPGTTIYRRTSWNDCVSSIETTLDSWGDRSVIFTGEISVHDAPEGTRPHATFFLPCTDIGDHPKALL